MSAISNSRGYLARIAATNAASCNSPGRGWPVASSAIICGAAAINSSISRRVGVIYTSLPA